MPFRKGAADMRRRDYWYVVDPFELTSSARFRCRYRWVAELAALALYVAQGWSEQWPKVIGRRLYLDTHKPSRHFNGSPLGRYDR